MRVLSRCRLLAVVAMMVAPAAMQAPPAAAAPTTATTLPGARDLAADGRVALKQHAPLIVLVSLGGCPQCEVVRRSHLLPLLRAAGDGAKPLIRQVELGGGETLVDFDGARITHATFARRHKVTIAPVVFFFDGNGKAVAEPLIGAMIPDFYGAYFDEALKAARAGTRSAAAEAAAPSVTQSVKR